MQFDRKHPCSFYQYLDGEKCLISTASLCSNLIIKNVARQLVSLCLCDRLCVQAVVAKPRILSSRSHSGTDPRRGLWGQMVPPFQTCDSVCAVVFITPRACARGKAIGLSVVVIVATKIATSEYLGITMVSKCNHVIVSYEKLLSFSLKRLYILYKRYKSCVYFNHAYLCTQLYSYCSLSIRPFSIESTPRNSVQSFKLSL